MNEKYQKDTDEIRTKVGDIFSIELESNPTTGFQWEPDIDSSKVRLIDEKFSSPTAIGAGGKEILTFQTLAEGDSTIRLNYKRPWEKDALETAKIKLRSEKK